MFMKNVSARLLTVAGATALILGVTSGTRAASPQNADLSVSATVEANCTITTTAVDFGSYDPIVDNLSTDAEAQGEVTVLCTDGASATVTLGQGVDPGPGSSDTTPARRLKHGTSDYLTYALYSDSDHSIVWGNTAGTGVSHNGSGMSTDLHVYGVLAAGQNKPVGTYSDTVVATVTF